METAARITKSERIRLRLYGFAFCPRCEKAVKLLSFRDAAHSFNTDLDDIELHATRGDLHRLHNWRAKVMICSLSLAEFFESRQTRLLDPHFTETLSAYRRP